MGILVIRFEMPFNVWCEGCSSHIGKGVRYNAEKKKTGNYYSTPIYTFTMKCHLCPQKFVIETDPKICDYVMVSGVKRKNEEWDPESANVIPLPDDDEKARMQADAMFMLEHVAEVRTCVCMYVCMYVCITLNSFASTLLQPPLSTAGCCQSHRT